MFETLIFTVGCVVGLALGLLIGKRWGRGIGEVSGFVRGLRAKSRHDDANLFEYRSKFQRYQCSRKLIVRRSWDYETLELASTSIVQLMGNSLLNLLLENRVLRPYIVSKETHNEGEVWSVELSMYCASDPVSMEFDNLPYIRERCQK